ncbi:MAG: hypothetical protein AAF591_01060 [Verrucomicrobiota bacterium]
MVLVVAGLGLFVTTGCVKRQIQVPTMTPPYVQPEGGYTGGYGDSAWK